MKRPFLILIVLLALIAAIAGWRAIVAADASLITLESGPFRAAYLVPDADATTLEITLLIQSGEADNTAAEGLAHYVEHLSWLNAYRGKTDERHANAWTTATATAYTQTTPPEDLRSAMSGLMGVLAPLTIDADFMDQERDIVLREYDLRIKSDPYADIYDAMLRSLYDNTPLSRSVIGSQDDIRGFTLPIATALRDASHTAGNAVMILRGDISMRAAHRAIADLQGANEAIDLPPLPAITDARLDDAQSVRAAPTVPPTFVQHRLVHAPDCGDGAACIAKINVLYDLFVSTLPGGLAKPLRYDSFTFRGFDITLDRVGNDNLILSIYGRPDTGQTLDDLTIAYEKALDDLARDGVSLASFTTIHDRIIDDWSDIENPADFVYDDLISQLSLREHPFDYTEAMDALERVTLTDINALLKTLNDAPRVVTRTINPIN